MSQEFETCGGCPTPTICSAWGRRSCSAAPVVDLAKFREARNVVIEKSRVMGATWARKQSLKGDRSRIYDKPALKSSTSVSMTYFDEIESEDD